MPYTSLGYGAHRRITAKPTKYYHPTNKKYVDDRVRNSIAEFKSSELETLERNLGALARKIIEDLLVEENFNKRLTDRIKDILTEFKANFTSDFFMLKRKDAKSIDFSQMKLSNVAPGRDPDDVVVNSYLSSNAIVLLGGKFYAKNKQISYVANPTQTYDAVNVRHLNSVIENLKKTNNLK